MPNACHVIWCQADPVSYLSGNTLYKPPPTPRMQIYYVLENNARLFAVGPDEYFGSFLPTFAYVVTCAALSEMIVGLSPNGWDILW